MRPTRYGLGSIVVDEEDTVWVKRRDFLQLLDACTGALGVRYLDSAQGYRKSEEAIGQWLQGQPPGFRDGLVIGSKVTRHPLDRASIVRIGHESLATLGCGVIDIYWSHAPDPATPVLETCCGFDHLAAAGLIREIGICNVSPAQISEVLSTCRAHGLRPPAWVQNEFNLLNFRSEQETVALCKAEGLGYMAYSPLAGGILSGKYVFDRPLPAGSRWGAWEKTRGLPDYWTAASFDALARFKDKAAAMGISMAGLALAWSGHHPGVTTTVLGPRHVGHLDALREALQTPLSPAQVEELGALFA